MNRRPRDRSPLALLVLAGAVVACQGPGASSGAIDAQLRKLPSWSTFSPPLEDTEPQPVEGGEVVVTERTGTLATITDEDTDGDGVADLEVLENVVSRCTSVPYTMTDTPKDIVM